MRVYAQIVDRSILKIINWGQIEKDDFEINKKGELILGDKKIPVNNDGSVILNWYGNTGTYEHIPLYKLLKAMDGDKKYQFDFNFEKIEYGSSHSRCNGRNVRAVCE